MFKALVLHSIQGIQQYLPHPGEENLHHHAVEQAAQHLLDNHVPHNYGHGIVTDLKGQLVVSL